MWTVFLIVVSLIGIQALSIVVTLFFNRFGIYGSGTWFGKIPYLTSNEK